MAFYDLSESGPMRVLQVINSLAVAGAEVLLVEVVRRLKQHGVTSDVYTDRKSVV